MSVYPAGRSARDRFVLDRRPARAVHDPWKPQGVIVEDERVADGTIVPVATIFLTGRECPWRCLMCDLWMHTTTDDTPRGAIAAQIVDARRGLASSHVKIEHVKLYNAGSFFDPRAVPVEDYVAIAEALGGCAHVIVESHPALVGPRTTAFVDALTRQRPEVTLEVAMGLETAHPEALDRINKGMNVDDFIAAAARLASMDVALRTFLLVNPPFVPASAHDEWMMRSIDVAFGSGASVVSLIPTRTGNGAIDALEVHEFAPPRLLDLERSLDAGLERVPRHGRLLVDLWDLERFAACGDCLAARRDRLQTMNLTQQHVPRVICATCGAGASSHWSR
jgi:radical SAM enzyme (TIGR01210 family)